MKPAEARRSFPSRRGPHHVAAAPIVWAMLWGLSVLRLEAVYAPIPAIEQGKPLTVYLATGVYYDSNVFGAETQEVDSMVYQFLPSIAFNASVGKRTFAAAAYRLSLDYIPDRPGDTLLDSHELTARVAHTVSPETELDISNSYQISKNPESLLPGIGTISGDQSFKRNQLDGRFTTSLTRRTGLLFKGRMSHYGYESATLSRELDRVEMIGGVTAAHALLPTLKSSAEYRFQSIRYDTGGFFKNKTSHFLLGGGDYALNDRVAVSLRVGAEFRQREGDKDGTTPFVELGAKRDYAKGSFVSVGYSHSVEETSNLDLFTDTVVNRFFVNWQHVITPKLTATASVVWEPSRLQGRSGISPDRNESNLRLGTAVVYRLLDTLSLSATVDIDRIESDQPGRDLARERFGLSARYAF